MSYSKNYTDKDWTVTRSYRKCISRALWNEVIPSLREVIMEWDSQKNTICFYFYHDGPITQAVEKHYGHINRLAHFQGPEIAVNTVYKIIRSDYPKCIPQREFVIYARKEPFVDPADNSPLPKGDAVFYRESYEREKPLPQNIEYSENDWKIIEEFRGYISRALWDEVIPSLRQVSMQWDPEEKIMWILFYHDGPITDAIAELYGFIDSL
ncbi:MAG TPA: hypothetical protein VIH61_03555, partial [Waddliaceae bacterium]